MTWTDAALARLKPRPEFTVVPGLRMLVGAQRRVFLMRFRTPAGAQRSLVLGPHDPFATERAELPRIKDPLTLSMARRLAAECARLNNLGESLVAAPETDEPTFGPAALRHVAEHLKKWRKSRWQESGRVLGVRETKSGKLEIIPGSLASDTLWGARKLSSLTRKDLKEIVELARDHGVPGRELRVKGPSEARARAAYSCISTFMSWAEEEDLIAHKPVLRGSARPKKCEPRDRVLSNQELRWIWTVAGNLAPAFACAVRLLMLLGLRRNEVCGLLQAEFAEDLSAIEIKAARMKGGEKHYVPLSDFAREVLAACKPVGKTYRISITGRGGVQGWGKAKKQLDDGMRELAAAENATCKPWRLHDLRRTCATRMLAWASADVVDAVLAHAPLGGGVRRAYNHYSYQDEKRAALSAWSEEVKRIVAPPQVLALADYREAAS
jgi:integrase